MNVPFEVVVSIAREQRLGCRRHVGLAHQAFADEECVDRDAVEAGDIGRREDPAPHR